MVRHWRAAPRHCTMHALHVRVSTGRPLLMMPLLSMGCARRRRRRIRGYHADALRRSDLRYDVRRHALSERRSRIGVKRKPRTFLHCLFIALALAEQNSKNPRPRARAVFPLSDTHPTEGPRAGIRPGSVRSRILVHMAYDGRWASARRPMHVSCTHSMRGACIVTLITPWHDEQP